MNVIDVQFSKVGGTVNINNRDGKTLFSFVMTDFNECGSQKQIVIYKHNIDDKSTVTIKRYLGCDSLGNLEDITKEPWFYKRTIRDG